MTGPLILVYNLDSRAEARLRALCQKQHLRCRTVSPEEYGQPIGALAGIPTAKAAEDAPQGSFTDPMLVMCNLLNSQFSVFLQSLRTGGLPRIPLKAVLTPTNVCWNSVQLNDELAREHAAMHSGGAGSQ